MGAQGGEVSPPHTASKRQSRGSTTPPRSSNTDSVVTLRGKFQDLNQQPSWRGQQGCQALCL